MTTPENREVASHSSDRQSPPERASILIVDDRQENLTAFETILSPLGHEIVLANSGTEALKKAIHRSFAVVLMDVRMPLMSGFETASILRKREAYRDTPIIFTSAYSVGAIDVMGGYVAGATDFIEMPAEGDLLRHKVTAFVERHFKAERIRNQAQLVGSTLESLKQAIVQVPEGKPFLARLLQLEKALLSLEAEISRRLPPEL